MEALVKRGLLWTRTEANEWIMSSDEEVSILLDGYVVSFMVFHERRLAVPPHRFFWGLLHYYGIELQHLNANGVQHITAFIPLCEGI
jgi:hypothetical protein